jgi:peptidylprolyl isomerase
MKLAAPLLLFAAATLPSTLLTAQTPAAKPATPASATAARKPVAAAPTCAKLPEYSTKIPALPAGLPCAKALYTITVTPPIKMDYVSPLVAPGLREYLGFETSTYSLAYVDAKIGTGPLAAPHKYYTIAYTGYLVDGTKFDSSFDHPDHEPITIYMGEHQVIPGWDTGFAGMHIGGKRRLFIPYQLGYGAQNYPPSPRPTVLPGKSELIFDVELISQSDEAPKPKAPPTPPPAANSTPKPAPTAPAPAAAAPATSPATTTAPAPAAPQTAPTASPASPATPATPKP